MNNSKEKNFIDNRGRRIVYVSNCILNMNARAPGLATRKGAVSELIQLFLNNDIGIEQLPCIECISWGGVSRKTISNKQSLVFNSVGKFWFPIIEFFSKFIFRKNKKASQKEAKRVVKRMLDYITEGYTIIGIIGENGSPTCGVTETMNYMEIIKNKEELGLRLKDLMHPSLEKMMDLEKKVRISGSGFFFNSIIKELKRRRLDIKVIGFEPQSEPQEEVEKMKNFLNLK